MSYCRTHRFFKSCWPLSMESPVSRRGGALKSCAWEWCRRGHEKWLLFPCGREGSSAALVFHTLLISDKSSSWWQLFHESGTILEKSCLLVWLAAGSLVKGPLQKVLCSAQGSCTVTLLLFVHTGLSGRSFWLADLTSLKMRGIMIMRSN